MLLRAGVMPALLVIASSGRGEIPHRRYVGYVPASPRAPTLCRLRLVTQAGLCGVSRSGAKPEPTVTVRMREDAQAVTRFAGKRRWRPRAAPITRAWF